MKIIALQGVGGIGKTTTLKKLFVEIANNFKSEIDHYFLLYPKKADKESIEKEIVEERNLRLSNAARKVVKNIIVVIIFKDKRRVAIITEGDDDRDLSYAMPILVALNCNLCFCACRTDGSSVEFLNKLKNGGNSVEYVSKAIERSTDKMDAVNDSQVKDLLKLL